MTDKASELAPLVNTRKEFLEFLQVLAEDYRLNGKEWENTDLGTFLEALTAYAQDIDGYYKNTNQPVNSSVPSWRGFAEMLCGAHIYE